MKCIRCCSAFANPCCSHSIVAATTPTRSTRGTGRRRQRHSPIDRVAQRRNSRSWILLDGTSSRRALAELAVFRNRRQQNRVWRSDEPIIHTHCHPAFASRANALSGNAYAGTSATSATVRITGASYAGHRGRQQLHDRALRNAVGRSPPTRASSRRPMVSSTASTSARCRGLGASGFGHAQHGGRRSHDGERRRVRIAAPTSPVTERQIPLIAKGNDVCRSDADSEVRHERRDDHRQQNLHRERHGPQLPAQSQRAYRPRARGINSVHSSPGEKARTVTGMNGTSLTIGGYLSSIVSGGANDSTSKRLERCASSTPRSTRFGAARVSARSKIKRSTPTSTRWKWRWSSSPRPESTIRDLDFASESANYAHNRVFQSSIAVLAQANQTRRPSSRCCLKRSALRSALLRTKACFKRCLRANTRHSLLGRIARTARCLSADAHWRGRTTPRRRSSCIGRATIIRKCC